MTLTDIKNSFEKNSNSVIELMNFDRIILDFCINHIESLNNKLKKLKITNPYMLADNTVSALTNIRKNNSMRNQYRSIFNQCLVLLVSHFTSAIEDIFRIGVDMIIVEGRLNSNEIDDSIKISINELRYLNFDLSGNFGDLLMRKKGISFQDMQSLNRTFKQYLGFSIEINNELNNIIFAQAARHTIIHASSIVNEKFMYQIRDTKPRDLKTNIKCGDNIEINPDEILLVSNSMKSFINNCITQIYNQTR